MKKDILNLPGRGVPGRTLMEYFSPPPTSITLYMNKFPMKMNKKVLSKDFPKISVNFNYDGSINAMTCQGDPTSIVVISSL